MNIEYCLFQNNHDALIAKLKHLDPTKRFKVEVKPFKSKRTLQQNKWIRAYASAFGKHFGYEADFAYDILMYKFNPVFTTDLEGNEIRKGGHFSSLDTQKAAEVQDAVLRYGIEHGFYWDETV
jgi:hypothetical protein